MRDATNILRVIQTAAVGAVDAMKMTDLVYGEVVTVSPLSIRVNQKLVLGEDNLSLTRAVQDYDVELSHSGSRLIYTVHNALNVGDRVSMIKAQGGQKYLVIDKEVI